MVRLADLPDFERQHLLDKLKDCAGFDVRPWYVLPHTRHAVVSTVVQPDDAPLQLKLTYFEFDYSGAQTRVLWIKVDDWDSDLTYATLTAELREDVMATMEPLITSKLEDHYKDTVANVKF